MSIVVIPAKTGTQEHPILGSSFRPCSWAPAFAGVTAVA